MYDLFFKYSGPNSTYHPMYKPVQLCSQSHNHLPTEIFLSVSILSWL